MKTRKTLNYEIEMFGHKYIAIVDRKNRKYGDTVRVILKDAYGYDLYKYISFNSAKTAAISAICAYEQGIPGFNF